MFTFLIVVLFGIFVGALTGLLPALPVYTGPFILYYFGHDLPLEHLMVFWLVVVTGSQFFGSISAITTGIPGEESSIVYLDDIKTLTPQHRNALLYDTALGSVVAGILSMLFVYGCVELLHGRGGAFLGSITFQTACYTLAMMSFIFLNRNIIATIGLVGMGILLGPKNNYVLPHAWYGIQSIFQGLTFYMILLGTIILPSIFNTNNDIVQKVDSKAVNNKTFSFIQGIKSTFIGIFAGLIPGPSAFLASLAAYKMAGKDICKKIISAETANNSSVITCVLPLLLMSLPINQNTLIFSNIMDVRSIDISTSLFGWSVFPHLTVMQLVTLSVLVVMCIYFWLSTHLISTYVKFIDLCHNRMKYILAVILTSLVAVDIYTSDITTAHYLIMLFGFSLFGMLLNKHKINALPFLFSLILGDKIVWLYLQFFVINFS